MIRSLDVSIDLGAEKALRERMRRVAGDARGSSVLDGDEHGARVRAVVGTRAANDRGLGQGKGIRGHDGLGAWFKPKLDGAVERGQQCSGTETQRRVPVQSLCGTLVDVTAAP